MKKCIDCEYYDPRCHAFATMLNKDNHHGVQKVTYTTGCIMENENNDCSKYKRKWWKFWVKDNK